MEEERQIDYATQNQNNPSIFNECKVEWHGRNENTTDSKRAGTDR